MTRIAATAERQPRISCARAAAIAILALVVGSQPLQARPAPSSQAQTVWAVQRPFRSDGAGVGGGDVLGQLRITPGAERAIASRALVDALQKMNLSVVRPQVELAGTIPPRREWESDIAELPRALIDGYNREASQLTLPVARYGIRFKGQHDVANSRFRYRMNALLFERGSVGSWRRVDDSRYVGGFFVGHLAGLIDGALTRSATSAP